MSTLSIEKSRNLESPSAKRASVKSRAPSRHKIPSAAIAAKTTLRPVESRATRIVAAKTPVQAKEPRLEGLTKQERILTLLSRPEGRASKR